MKPALLLAYDYPPIVAVGRNRTLRFERHLRTFGYEPIIHTVRNPDRVRVKTSPDIGQDLAHVHRSWSLNLGWLAVIVSWTADKVARIFGVDLRHDPIRRLLFFPDVHIGWIPHCVVKSLSLIRQHRVSVIYVTCSPFSAAITGVILKWLTGLPLVLDFRDPWSFNDHNVDLAYLRPLIRATEARLVAASDALIANTVTAARTYRELYPGHAAKITHIHNGITAPPSFEPERSSCFTLLYVGAFYNVEYLDLLFETVKAFDSAEIRIEFAGFDSAALTQAIARHHVQERVVLHGFIESPQQLKRIYQRASVLLYYNGFTADGRLITSVVRAKLYDYLATGVPILAIAPTGEAAELLGTYSPASVNVAGDLVTGDLPSQFANALADMYRRWQRGELTTQPNEEFLRMFGGEELTRRLAVVFDRVTANTLQQAPARVQIE